MSVRVSFEVTDELHEKLVKLAADMERSLEQVLVLAAEDFDASERPLLDRLLEADQQFADGHFVTHSQVESWSASLTTTGPLPEADRLVEQKMAS